MRVAVDRRTNEGPSGLPGKPSHRGPDPHDASAFDAASLPALRGAAVDFCWLLSRGYASVSALKLVGDRFSLTERQRQAVRRSACSDDDRAMRLTKNCSGTELSGYDLVIDGFNVLTTIEAALGGAVVLSCRDSTFRDIAGLHGTYRRVAETAPALDLLGAGNLRPEHPPMSMALRSAGLEQRPYAPSVSGLC